jgi:hypothetical protein
VPSSEPEEAVAAETNGRRGVGIGVGGINVSRRREEGGGRARSSAAVLAVVAFEASLLLLLLLRAVAESTPARRELMFSNTKEETEERNWKCLKQTEKLHSFFSRKKRKEKKSVARKLKRAGGRDALEPPDDVDESGPPLEELPQSLLNLRCPASLFFCQGLVEGRHGPLRVVPAPADDDDWRPPLPSLLLSLFFSFRGAPQRRSCCCRFRRSLQKGVPAAAPWNVDGAGEPREAELGGGAHVEVESLPLSLLSLLLPFVAAVAIAAGALLDDFRGCLRGGHAARLGQDPGRKRGAVVRRAAREGLVVEAFFFLRMKSR